MVTTTVHDTPRLHVESLVQRASELLGAPQPASAGGAGPGEPAEPLEALQQLANRAGLRADVFAAPLEVALRSLSRERPLAALGSDGEPLMLVEARGSRVWLEAGAGRPRWVASAELIDRLGLRHANEECRWLSLQSPNELSLPLDAKASPWRNALALLQSEGVNLATIVVYAIGVGLLSLVLPLAVQTLVNTVAFGQLMQPIFVLTLLLAGGLVFAATLRAVQAWVVELVQRRIFVRLVSELAIRLPKVDAKAFERGEGPELVNRFFDVFIAQKAIASLLLGGTESILTAVVGVVVLAFYHPALLAFGLLLLASAFVVFVSFGHGATRTTIAESKAKYAVAGWLEEMTRHPFLLKMAGGAEHARRRLDRLAVDWLQRRAAHYRVYYRQLIGALALQVAAHATLLGLGGWLVVERDLTIGQLVAAELIVTAVVASLSKLGGKLESVYDLIAAADKLGALLSLPLEESGGSDSVRSGSAASLELRSVTSADRELTDFSLQLLPGTCVAVRGGRRSSEALADLLFGLRLPSKGALLVDGQDLRDIPLETLRRRVAVVRTPEIFPGTVAENVGAAGREVPASEIWQVLDQVGLAGVVRALPRGLRSELTTSGSPLDRLEALRLTLARAIAARPGLLVLDGVLDFLPEDERGLLLRAVSRGTTVVVLTHEQAVSEICMEAVELPHPQRRVAGPSEVPS